MPGHGHGCRAELSVRLGVGWVTLDCPAPGPLYLRPRQAGQARAALREAVLDLELLDGVEPAGSAMPPAGGEVTGGRREVLPWHQPARPTVAEIEARLVIATAAPPPETDHPDAVSQLPSAAA